jgi:hypothetical protein
MNRNKKSQQSSKSASSARTHQPRKPSHSIPSGIYASLNNPLTADYLKSLVDPFEFSGPKLGWGTMVPTRVVQAYTRGTATANADGSLVLLAAPTCTGMVAIYNGGAAVAGPTSVLNAGDQGTIQSSFTDGRIVSIGIRSYPVIAATSVPGIAYAGALPCPLIADMVVATGSLTPNDFVLFPSSHMSIGRDGCSATGRPSDPSSFIFTPYPITGANAPDVDVPFSVPYNCYEGLPASAVVAYEVCLNIEGTTKESHGSVALGLADDSGGVLSDVWNSIEQLWSGVKNILPSPGRAMEWIASYDADGLSGALKSAASSRAASSSLSALFGYGMNKMASKASRFYGK